jgi:hypothetical protein
MSEMIDALDSATGSDVSACAQMWLEQKTSVPTPGPCP